MKPKTLLLALLVVLPAHAPAQDAPPAVEPPPQPEQLLPPEAEAPYQVLVEARQRVRWLDEAVFTDISPLTVPEKGIRLPEDQQH